MKLSDLVRVAALSLLPASFLSAQNLDSVFKAQAFFQNSASAPALLPDGWVFSAQSPATATLNVPGGGTVALVFNASNKAAKFAAGFATKAAMDTAYANGTYTWSGTPTPSAALTGDLYTAATPQVTGGGTWSNGILVVDPTVATTLTFSTFSDFATTSGGQVGGHMDFSFSSNNGADQVDLDNQLLTQPLFGLPASSTPFTSYVIPPGTLTAGNVYQATLSYDRLSSLDTTTVSGGAVIAIYQKYLMFYVVAKSATTGGLTPPSATIPATVTASLGGSITIQVSGSGLGSQGGTTNNPNATWFYNGTPLNLGASTKYSMQNGQNLTINTWRPRTREPTTRSSWDPAARR